MIAPWSCYRFVGCTSIPPHWLEIWWLWGPFEYSERCHVQRNGRKMIWAWRDGHGQQQSFVAFKKCSVGTKGPKVCLTPLHHHHQSEPLIQGGMEQYFHVVYSKFWPHHLNVAAEIETYQTRHLFFPIFYCPVLVNLCDLLPQFPGLRWQEWHSVWSFAAVAHLLQGWACCAFRDCILHTLVVTSSFEPFYHLEPVCTFSSDLWHQQDIFVHKTASH